jgi:hypothetical protein
MLEFSKDFCGRTRFAVTAIMGCVGRDFLNYYFLFNSI